MPLDEVLTFRQAINYVAQKNILPTSLTSDQLKQLSTDSRERAFFSATNEISSVLDRLRDEVQKIVDGNVTEMNDAGTIRLSIKEALASVNYSPEAGKAGTIQDLSSDSRINLVVDTNIDMAQGYGAWTIGQDEGALDQYPAQELYRKETRKEPRDWPKRWEEHGGQIYDGRMIAKKNATIWESISEFGQPYPPFDFNSGMGVRDVDRGEAESLGIIAFDEQIKPQSRSFELPADVTA